MDADRSDAINGDAIDRELQDLLAAEPSVEFTAQVRARIAQEQRTLRFAWPQLAVAGAGVAAVAVAAVMMMPATRETPVQVTNAAATPSLSVPAVTVLPEPPAAPPIQRTRDRARRAAVRTEPDVIMPKEEIRGMQRLLAMAAAADARLTAMFDIPETSTIVPLPSPAPIVIEPLTIEPLVPDSY